MTKTERNLIFLFIILFFSSFGFIGYRFYISRTQIVPSLGGKYSEGIIGSPRYLNPLLSQTNDSDRDLTRVIFSSLLKYDENGGLINDLAESYSIEDAGKTYNFIIKNNVFWHDGEKLNADDILFTVQTIQNADFRSPLWVSWVGVDIEKVDEFTLRFKLKNAYPTFLYNLTFGILPKHIWQNISSSDFALSDKNLKPIGSGPYVFKALTKNSDGTIQSVELTASKKFYLGGPFIKTLFFEFFSDEDKAIQAWRKGEIQGLNYISPKNVAIFDDKQKQNTSVYRFTLPRYFSLFINQTLSKPLADKNVRIALAVAIDKEKMINDVLLGFGEPVDSPILPGMIGYTNQIKTYPYDIAKANEILTAGGWIDTNNDAVRDKDGTPLEFSLSTIPWAEFVQNANLLKDTWGQIGAKVNIEIKDVASLQQDNIKPRQYLMLLFGELLNIDPDPFFFWHSSQKKDPGLNLALYENARVDAILQDARQDLDPASRAKKYEQFTQIIAEDLPVIFLYSPSYLYPLSGEIKGANFKLLAMPSDRFSQLEKWYISSARKWKD